jgi:4-amino-4-deoxy-L-arabinose transferase-like glycosyltransferase
VVRGLSLLRLAPRGAVESGLFAALTAAATLLLLRLRERAGVSLAVLAGVALGAALLTRAMLLPFAVLVVAWLLVPGPSLPPLRRRLASAAIVAAATLAVLSPWLVRSHALTGSYSLGTEGGQSLYAGASPMLFARFPEHSVDESRALHIRLNTARA